MEFEKRKAATLAAMNSPEADKSPKGTLDAPIVPLLDALNSHPSYFTTSSCSGRISVLSQPAITSTTAKKKARGGTWVFITHDSADLDTVVDLLFSNKSNFQVTPPTHPHNLVFRFEPLIIAVECKELASAQFLVSLAISCGFRESGITSVSKRVIIAIRCSIRLEVPMGDTQKLMVSPEYVRYLVEVANGKMEANRRRTDSFLQALLSNGFQIPDIDVGKVQNVTINGEVNKNNSLKFIDTEKPESSPNFLCDDADRDIDFEKIDFDKTRGGSLEVPDVSLSMVQMFVVDEPVERLFLWGHSASELDFEEHQKVLIFGGFGGTGRHARRNDSLLLDPVSGKLEAVGVQGAPSQRLGHTSCIIGDYMYVIGGRADPINILNEVWALNIAKNEWRPLQCTGSIFSPRHRHAAAVVGSNIYVFGGINNDGTLSSFFVLNIDNLEWKEIMVRGECPCPRHSHSLVAYGSQIFTFGGHDGEKALGDLYSFDAQTYIWKKEKTLGRAPYARFSHSMFVYKNYLGIIGGCPVRQHYQELSLFHLRSHFWKHVMVNTIGKSLIVRSTASVVGDDLVMIGGGASCYAFGTKFSEPMKVNLLPLMSLLDNPLPSKSVEEPVNYQDKAITDRKNGQSQILQNNPEEATTSGRFLNVDNEEVSVNDRNQVEASCWVLRLERKYAKKGKDLLKKFGWLDLGRKVYLQEDEMHICFPVTEKFCTIFHHYEQRSTDASKGIDDLHLRKPFNDEGHILKDISCTTALDLLMACGATKLADEVVKFKKTTKSPLKIVGETVASLMDHHGLPAQLLEQLPTRWERLGDIIVLPVASFKDPMWDTIGEKLWPIVAKALSTRRLARQGRIAPTGTRDSTLEMLVGDSGWVEHRENGILYSFDATKCMFSWGNLSEKLRMARLDCRNEVVVDLFAGIGYFVLPLLVRANAKMVYACEWNPHAVEALKHNLHANSVADRAVVLEGDNRLTAPKGVADRVSLGLLPSSEGSWITAVRALRSCGGILHVHGNVKDSEEDLWTEHVSRSINEISRSEGYCWEVSVEHVERVKWYAPHVRHLVADVRCKQIFGQNPT